MHALYALEMRGAIRSPVAKIMSHVIPIDPLHRYPSVRTSDPDEFQHVLTSIYGANGLTIPNPRGLQARGNLLKLSDIAIGFSASGARAIVSFDECHYARLQIPITGQSATTSEGATTIVQGDTACVTSPGHAATLDYGHGYEQLVLRIGTDILERKLTALLGVRPRQPIRFEPAACSDPAADQALRSLLAFMIRQIDDNPNGLPLLVLKGFEKAVVVNFLAARRHNFSEQLSRNTNDTAPWQVSRAEEYIEANWDQPFSVEKLAEETGVGIRALFATFQKCRGYSPMAFAKTVRLRRARAMLQQAAPGASVTGIALACGFANQGHFARDYRATFGELPSETLARRKRGSSP